VLNRQLAGRAFICGDYSIADMASYPWIVPHKRQGQDLADFPNVQRWFEAIRARPATVAAYAAGEPWVTPLPPGGMSEEAKKVLFGQTAQSIAPRV
jgi:GST-like protein